MFKQFITKELAQAFINQVNEFKGYDPTSKNATNNYANPLEGNDGWYVVCTDEVIEQFELTDLVDSFEPTTESA